MKSEIKELLGKTSIEFKLIRRSDSLQIINQKAREWVNNTLPNWNFILIAVFPYFIDEPKDRLSIARYAWGLDYHKVVHSYLQPVVEYLNNYGHQAVVFCDTSPMPERELAAHAGLGALGLNGLLINKQYGSYMVLGGLISNGICSDEEYDDFTETKTCLLCGECIKACPGAALTVNGLNAVRCISAITQKRGKLSMEEEDLLRENSAVWGCDRCQEACPMNIKILETTIPEFRERLIKNIEPDVIEMSNKRFKETYGDRAFSWRGASVLKRNITLSSKQENHSSRDEK